MRQRSNEALVEEYRPLVRRTARYLKHRLPRSVEIADLEQAGMAGLIEAAPRFNGTDGASFETFIGYRVRGAMLDSLREGDWVPRSVARASRELAQAIRAIEVAEQRPARESEIASLMGLTPTAYRKMLLDVSVQHVFSSEDHAEHIHGVTEGLTQNPLPPDEVVEMEGFLGRLHKAIAKLPERERMIIERTYFDGATLEEVAVELGISESRVCQLRTQAVARLRAQLLGDE